MKLTPPKVITFWIAVVLGLLGLLIVLGVLPAFLPAFWLAFIGLALFAIAVLVEGL